MIAEAARFREEDEKESLRQKMRSEFRDYAYSQRTTAQNQMTTNIQLKQVYDRCSNDIGWLERNDVSNFFY